MVVVANSTFSVDDSNSNSPRPPSPRLVLRASHLLERLEDLGGLDGGLTEEDLLVSREVREPFRTLCGSLCSRVRGLSAGGPEKRLRGALHAVERTIGSEDASGGGRLDRSLTRVAKALNGASACRDRIDVLEEIVQYVQASSLLRAATAMEVDDPVADPVALSASVRELAGVLTPSSASSSASSCLSSCRAALASLVAAGAADHASPLPPVLDRSKFSDSQLGLLERVNAAMHAEYKVRRQTLSKRAAVTLQSLQHSSRIRKDQGEEVRRIIEGGIAKMGDEPRVNFQSLFAVREVDLQDLQSKITHGGLRNFKSSVKGVIIGKVPDRGGRVSDKRSSNSMPEWAPRRSNNNSKGNNKRKQQKQ
ncbi:hypothetical protein HOP50_02g16420 [Chloropicon primus]|nr:hypothetical protein HOP50_02g16420 [Chloropicon primus]